jgi:hypothetical protein
MEDEAALFHPPADEGCRQLGSPHHFDEDGAVTRRQAANRRRDPLAFVAS